MISLMTEKGRATKKATLNIWGVMTALVAKEIAIRSSTTPITRPIIKNWIRCLKILFLSVLFTNLSLISLGVFGNWGGG